jgi:hypothetical protein
LSKRKNIFSTKALFNTQKSRGSRRGNHVNNMKELIENSCGSLETLQKDLHEIKAEIITLNYNVMKEYEENLDNHHHESEVGSQKDESKINNSINATPMSVERSKLV